MTLATASAAAAAAADDRVRLFYNFVCSRILTRLCVWFYFFVHNLRTYVRVRDDIMKQDDCEDGDRKPFLLILGDRLGPRGLKHRRGY